MQEEDDKLELNKAIELFITGIITLSAAAELCDMQTSEMVKLVREREIHSLSLPDNFYKKRERGCYKVSRKKAVREVDITEEELKTIDDTLDESELPELDEDVTTNNGEQNQETADEPKERVSRRRGRRPGGMPAKIEELLKVHGAMRLKDIMHHLGVGAEKEGSLSWTLINYVNNKKIFRRVAPGIYGLIAVDDEKVFHSLANFTRRYQAHKVGKETTVNKVKAILQERGALRIREIASILKIDSTPGIKGLRKLLDNYVIRYKYFERTAPGTYGLLEFKQQAEQSCIKPETTIIT